MDYGILVNKKYPVDETYIPENLVKTQDYNGPKIDNSYDTLVEINAFNAFLNMQKDALKSGYHIIVDSGYRPYEYQKKILEYNIALMGDEAYKTVALPGTSEHQTGLAIDIALMINGNYVDTFDDSLMEIQWVHQNAYKYGFILRYPQGKESITGYSYECWHLRFVGFEISNFMHEKNIETLEEYYLIQKKRSLENI